MSTSNDLHDDSIVTPAADAGPRCTVCQAPIYHSMLAGWSHYNSQSHRAVPPVPQEAAPDICVCGTERNPIGYCKVCDKFYPPVTPATAPDWAMRVAEKFVTERMKLDAAGCPKFIADLAALIREAGSERERQLETLVRKMAGCTVCKNCTAEASRLLGGE
jgi:hypothetical protein